MKKLNGLITAIALFCMCVEMIQGSSSSSSSQPATNKTVFLRTFILQPRETLQRIKHNHFEKIVSCSLEVTACQLKQHLRLDARAECWIVDNPSNGAVAWPNNKPLHELNSELEQNNYVIQIKK